MRNYDYDYLIIIILSSCVVLLFCYVISCITCIQYTNCPASTIIHAVRKYYTNVTIQCSCSERSLKRFFLIFISTVRNISAPRCLSNLLYMLRCWSAVEKWTSVIHFQTCRRPPFTTRHRSCWTSTLEQSTWWRSVCLVNLTIFRRKLKFHLLRQR